MTFKCIIFFKKSKMRFGHYLLHFRPFWTSKSDLKIVQKSIKNRSGNKHRILQSFELHFLTSKWKHREKRSKKGPKTGWEKWCQESPGDPFDPRRTPDGPQMDPRSSKVVEQTPKWPQNESKMRPKWHQHVSFLDWKGHVIFVSCVKNGESSVWAKQIYPKGNDRTVHNNWKTCFEKNGESSV